MVSMMTSIAGTAPGVAAETAALWEQLFALSGRVAIVTGAGSGIGREIARVLGRAGARVVVADRNVAAGEEAADGLVSAGIDAAAVPVDIGDTASIAGCCAATVARYGAIDILVNNAAIFPKYNTLEITTAEWDALLAVTLRGTMFCSQAAVRQMRAQGNGGRIVNISSCSSLQTLVHDNAAYGAAKAGVNMLTRTYALEFAGDAITVNAVLPGGVQTGGQSAVMSSRKITGPITGAGRVPLGRTGTPADIAAAVLYFASPAASYVTGQLLAVDGGFLIS
jgi:NAD(P)-dependent dehydrogenase (short-subunit alcohol dehydrogenase family)